MPAVQAYTLLHGLKQISSMPCTVLALQLHHCPRWMRTYEYIALCAEVANVHSTLHVINDSGCSVWQVLEGS